YDAGLVVPPCGYVPPVSEVASSLLVEDVEALLLGHDPEELLPEHVVHWDHPHLVVHGDGEDALDDEPLDGVELDVESLPGLDEVNGVKKFRTPTDFLVYKG